MSERVSSNWIIPSRVIDLFTMNESFMTDSSLEGVILLVVQSKLAADWLRDRLHWSTTGQLPSFSRGKWRRLFSNMLFYKALYCQMQLFV